MVRHRAAAAAAGVGLEVGEGFQSNCIKESINAFYSSSKHVLCCIDLVVVYSIQGLSCTRVILSPYLYLSSFSFDDRNDRIMSNIE